MSMTFKYGASFPRQTRCPRCRGLPCLKEPGEGDGIQPRLPMNEDSWRGGVRS